MPTIGPVELGIVLVIAIIIFGPKKIPELGSSIGRSIREFKVGIADPEDKPAAAKSAAPASASVVAAVAPVVAPAAPVIAAAPAVVPAVPVAQPVSASVPVTVSVSSAPVDGVASLPKA